MKVIEQMIGKDQIRNLKKFSVAEALSKYDIKGGMYNAKQAEQLELFDSSLYKTEQMPKNDYSSMPALGYNAGTPQKYFNSAILGDYLGIHR